MNENVERLLPPDPPEETPPHTPAYGLLLVGRTAVNSINHTGKGARSSTLEVQDRLDSADDDIRRTKILDDIEHRGVDGDPRSDSPS